MFKYGRPAAEDYIFQHLTSYILGSRIRGSTTAKLVAILSSPQSRDPTRPPAAMVAPYQRHMCLRLCTCGLRATLPTNELPAGITRGAATHMLPSTGLPVVDDLGFEAGLLRSTLCRNRRLSFFKFTSPLHISDTTQCWTPY